MRTLTDFKSFPDFSGHQQVIEISRPEVGLRGFIAIHSNVLGPAVGGTRMYPYKTEREAITDVLRLSHAMTYKCALAGVKFGGGKGVVVGDPKKIKNEMLLNAYAEEINNLKGRFYTGEDVGLQEDDVAIMLRTSKYFIGRADQAGDPSPYAAQSVFVAMRAACNIVYGSPSILGKRIAVKGVGKVGSELVRLLLEAEAKVFISDIDKEVAHKVSQDYPDAIQVSNEFIARQECDIYSPCALGGEFTKQNIQLLKAKIICGGANNQLENDEMGQLLMNKHIIYVPDYVSNAGGLIDVVDELNPSGFDPNRVNSTIKNIEKMVYNILSRSNREKIPTNIVSNAMAEEVLTQAKKE